MGERVSQEHYHEIGEFDSTLNSWGIHKEFWCHLEKFRGDKLKKKNRRKCTYQIEKLLLLISGLFCDFSTFFVRILQTASEFFKNFKITSCSIRSQIKVLYQFPNSGIIKLPWWKRLSFYFIFVKLQYVEVYYGGMKP